MIARYSRAQMVDVFSDHQKLKRWLRVETEASREWQGSLPRKEMKEMIQALDILSKKGVDPREVEEIEKITHHDVIAFTTVVANKIGLKKARFLHFGLTSSDVVDTALSLSLQEGGELLMEDLDQVLDALHKKAIRFKKRASIGRTHGVFAEPMSFGLKFLAAWTEFSRGKERLERALENARFGKLSGAVGTNSHLSPKQELRVLKRLGLKREPLATQVLPRDRFAEVFSALGILAGSVERLCLEIRHLSRTEVGEAREGFRKGQKGSSAMPHKRNPIASENLTGCARMIRSHVVAGLENIALWHERDISHSSVERVFLPDGFILMDYVLARLANLIQNLEVLESGIQKNLDTAGTKVFSGHLLLALVVKGAIREEAYYWVQECALTAQDEGRRFEDLATAHPQIRKYLKPSEIKEKLSMKYQLRNLEAIYQEVFSGR